MEPMSVVLACTTALSAGGLVWSLRQQARQSAEMRVMREELIAKEGERATAMASRVPLEEERDALRDELREMQNMNLRAEKEVSALREKLASTDARHAEIEKAKQQMEEAAKAAVMKAGSDLSTKLLEDHKRENEEAKRQTQEITARMMENAKLLEERLKVAETHAGAASDKAEMMMRALTNPSGAGKMGEVGLENLLKSFGLECPRDFQMQYHIAGEESGSLRPDAVIYLPQNTAIIIDCKASKHVFELETARGTEQEAEIFEKFKSSMQAHAKALATKDYKNAFENDCRKAGREIGTTLSLMYIPSDGSIARLRELAPGLCDYLQKADILIVGPTTLYGVCSLASTRLAEAQRMESYDLIAKSVSELMESVITAIAYAEGMGRGIKTLADSYAKFASSINGRMIGRLKKLNKMGVSPSNNKPIPARLPIYDVQKHEEVLDLEAEDATTDEKVVAITAS